MANFDRDRLEAYSSPVCQALPRFPPPHLPPLTSDLFHVENCLQSRVKLLEKERKEAGLHVLQLEKTLALQKEKFHTLMETLRAEHEEAMYKVTCGIWLSSYPGAS